MPSLGGVVRGSVDEVLKFQFTLKLLEIVKRYELGSRVCCRKLNISININDFTKTLLKLQL